MSRGRGTRIGTVPLALAATLSLRAVAQSELSELLEDVDVMYAMYSPHRGNIVQGALPVKVFDAASRGVPSVVNADCLMADLVEHESIGASAPWGNPEAVGQALRSVRDASVELRATGEREHQRWLTAMKPVFVNLQ